MIIKDFYCTCTLLLILINKSSFFVLMTLISRNTGDLHQELKSTVMKPAETIKENGWDECNRLRIPSRNEGER